MCYFITVGVPRNKIDDLKSSIPRNLHLAESNAKSVRSYIKEDYALLLLTTGGCSCDLFSEESSEDKREKYQNNLRKKYKRKKWSNSKIEKAINQAMSSYFEKSVGLRDDVKKFLSNSLNKLNEMFLVIHWYNGEVEDERFSLKIGPKISLSQLNEENYIKATDEIYIITMEEQGL